MALSWQYSSGDIDSVGLKSAKLGCNVLSTKNQVAMLLDLKQRNKFAANFCKNKVFKLKQAMKCSILYSSCCTMRNVFLASCLQKRLLLVIKNKLDSINQLFILVVLWNFCTFLKWNDLNDIK